ncbi:MAG: hypothetical protein IT480_11750 [Gammaproteobacteria bacterium]|nr:hypothetical protein [Gammaproteobacteria bacterium]
MIRTLLSCLPLLATGAVLAATPAAQPWPASPITDHFAIRGGWLGTGVDTRGRVDPAPDMAGSDFSAEDDFKQSDGKDQLRVELMFRLRERGRVRVDMWELSRKGTSSPATPLVYGAYTFQAPDVVQTQTDWRQIDVTWTYSFLRGSRYELGAGLGLHLVQAEAQAHVRNRVQPVREEFSGAGPFATVALDGTWRFARRWSLSARAQYFNLTVGSVSGMLGDYHGDVQYRWRRNVAFGIGYQSTQVQIEVSDSDPNGRMHMSIAGPEAFVRASF